ncbi:MAG TPA: ATP-binding protein [Candidatus Aenigmarchaeota archaeon]|nr:MAG: hypothetical protein DRP03_02540 [Candidatus Aenigmarchaeota archaeon]HDD45999.1 ATP-binding protein [Candidatus Aenigmarchaeota archaeon]
MLIGRITGSVTTNEFSFIAEARVRKSQYVAVKDFEGRWVLASIYSVINYVNKSIAKAQIIGYRDERGFLKTPNVPFEPDTPVFTATSEFIKSTLGLKDEGLYIGMLSGYRIKVKLPIKHLITKHVAILAKTGSGKSYAAGVLLEELMENNVPIVVIDPHGEYISMIRENKKKEELRMMETFDIKPKSYKKQIEIFSLLKYKPLKLNGMLTANEIINMLPTKISAAQKGLIYSAIKNLEGKEYTVRDVIDEINSMESQSKWSLIPLLEILDSSGLFSLKPTQPKELVKSGKMSIINLKDVQPEIQQIVVMKLAEELFAARKRNEIPEFFFVIEEAHNYCPERGFGEVPSSKIMRSIASEGRKFGIGLCIISQRPAKVDKNVLSQCNTQIILKVTNPNDLKAIMESVEGITTTSKNEIKDLAIGTALVVGVFENSLLVDIRTRRSEHGGEGAKEGKKGTETFYSATFLKQLYGRKDVLDHYKGVEPVGVVNYPLWLVKGKRYNRKVRVFVDGILGEVIFYRNDDIDNTSGIKKIAEIPPSKRNILIYMIKNKVSTAEKISKDMGVPVSTVKAGLATLKKAGILSSDDFMYRCNLNINLPRIDELELPYETERKELRGLTLDFMVSDEYARKIASIFLDKVEEVGAIYMPHFLVLHRNRKLLINMLNNKLDLDRSKIVGEMV